MPLDILRLPVVTHSERRLRRGLSCQCRAPHTAWLRRRINRARRPGEMRVRFCRFYGRAFDHALRPRATAGNRVRRPPLETGTPALLVRWSRYVRATWRP